MGTRWQGWPVHLGERNCKVATSTFPRGEGKRKKRELSSLWAIKEQLMKSPATENRQKHRKKSLQSLPEQPWHSQGSLAGVYLVPVISSFPAARRRAALPWQCQGELGEGRARDFFNREGSSTEATVQSKRQSGAAKWARWKPQEEKKPHRISISVNKQWQNQCNAFGVIQLLLPHPSLGLLRAFEEG